MGLRLVYKASGIAHAFEREALRFVDRSLVKYYRQNYQYGTPLGNEVFDRTARQSLEFRQSVVDDFALSIANFMLTTKDRNDEIGYSIFEKVADDNYDLVREELSYRIDKILLDAWITRAPF